MKVPFPENSDLKCAKVKGVGVKVPILANNLGNIAKIFQKKSQVANPKNRGDPHPAKQSNKGVKMPAGVPNFAKDSEGYQVANTKVNISLAARPRE